MPLATFFKIDHDLPRQEPRHDLRQIRIAPDKDLPVQVIVPVQVIAPDKDLLVLAQVIVPAQVSVPVQVGRLIVLQPCPQIGRPTIVHRVIGRPDTVRRRITARQAIGLRGIVLLDIAHRGNDHQAIVPLAIDHLRRLIYRSTIVRFGGPDGTGTGVATGTIGGLGQRPSL